MKIDSGSLHSITDCRMPHQGLQSFVHEYIFRKMKIPEGCHVEKTLPLRSESSIVFFLGDSFRTVNLQTQQRTPFERCTIRGAHTRILYSIRPQGTFISFIIKFKATGLYKLLGIPMDIFTDRAIPGSSIEELPFPKITEQLLFAPDIEHCIRIIEPYLLSLAEGAKEVHMGVDKAVQAIAQYPGLHSISELASNSYMSQRQLQRCFIKYMGICPKTYCRMSRFLRLLHAKEKKPDQKWAALAHEFGYYDQMHLIKEFKKFLKTLPSAFAPADFAF